MVGLGGSGLACIDELLRLGLSVAGLDAGAVGNAAAGRNGGLLRAGIALFHHEAVTRLGPRRAARLYAATRDERERLLAMLPGNARRVGYLRLAADAAEEADCRIHLEALRTDGFPSAWYDGPLGRGVLVPDDAACDPFARCQAEASTVSRAGARLFEQSPAVGFARGVVDSVSGRVRCRFVVVAVDGGLPEVFPELAGRVRPTRLQMLASSSHAPDALPHAVGTRWGWDYAQQLPDGAIAFGGCRDVGGNDEHTSDAVVTGAVQTALERRFRDVLGVAPRVTHRWASIVGYTDSGLPVVEEIRPGIWAVGGYSGTGNLLGAVCGRLAARLATGRATESPIA